MGLRKGGRSHKFHEGKGLSTFRKGVEAEGVGVKKVVLSISRGYWANSVRGSGFYESSGPEGLTTTGLNEDLGKVHFVAEMGEKDGLGGKIRNPSSRSV